MVDDKKAGELGTAPTLAPNAAIAETIQSDQTDYAPIDLAPLGYQLGAMLGRGGMGEVITAEDQRVGREVAYKRLRERDASPDALARFLREARIQARLDHPAIVPVYEVGKDPDGRPFFTMKRLTGKTLAATLESGNERLQPLLRAFAEVCLAIEMAHSRGIVHRDLKPSNIMLGDFGEVYVLDWGVARVMNETAREPGGAGARGDLDSIGEGTSGGALLGTPGYMAPEQVRGEKVTGKADVYALGSILFELLAGEPLHPRGHPAVQSTLTMETASPADRRPDRAIPPELDRLCRGMLAAKADDRPTARKVAQHIQRYLDGDRDLEARRELAKEFLATARAALALGERPEALRAAGRALALDPHSADAAELVTGIIVEPPTKLPTELVEELDAQDRLLIKARGRRAITGYASLLSLSALLVFVNVENWAWLGALYGAIVALMFLSWRTYRTGTTRLVGVLSGTIILAILFARVASPFIIVPSLLCATMVAISNIAWLNERPLVLYAWVSAAGSIPLLLEWLGVLSTTTFATENAIVIDSAILGPSGAPALAALAVANAVLLIFVARFALLVARDRRAAVHRLTVQAWHLAHLLPETSQVDTGRRATTS